MIKVYVIDYGRKYYYLQWQDEATGKRITQSSKATNRRAAGIKAVEKEAELNSGTVAEDGTMTWEAFRATVDDDVLSGLAARTAEKVRNIFNVMEEFQRPQIIRDLNSRYLSRYVGWLRANDREESTIQSHMRHLKSMLRWVVSNHYSRVMPSIPVITRASKGKVMKGRPLTDAEVKSYLASVEAVVGVEHADRYRFMAEGILVSSLRLEESMSLSWDLTADFHVMIDGDRVKFRIPASADKGNEDSIFPTTPDCWEFLLKVPPEQRTGFVFNPTFTNHRNGRTERYKNSCDVSRVFSKIGEMANIVVDHNSGKFASAHDFRRTFGNKWARLGTPSFLLKELMRHSSIATTEMYYLEANANQTQDEIEKIWNRARLHNTPDNTSENKDEKTQEST
eukprot:TRINITY_DN2347_c0_g1_i3.p1 TRINITY_DN2347_c0_g1~~TRINITY_DN2347_c0_g1_i3.p1  ORF type:complete len:395 (+),score=53.88 TRINITY_DN2347_c0_g1_i3:1513-2697(+)